MQIKPVYLSSKSKTSIYQTKYNLDPNTFWQGQYIVEISGYSSTQLRLLNSICISESHILCLYESQESKKILLHFLKRNLNLEQISGIIDKDNELGEFFNQALNFFSDLKKPIWKIRETKLNFSQSPFIMGILNVTPDSFSDGGQFSNISAAADHALIMIDAGVDIIDIGGESTRPGSDAVSIGEELQRVIPVIEAIRKHTDVPVSIDSYKSEVAEAAIEAGADIVNDISGCTFDERMPDIVKKHDIPIVLMHIKGTPKNMQMNPEYDDVCLEVYQFLSKQIKWLEKSGIDKIAIDPGIGFGKRLQDNLQIINNFESFKFLGRPILIGASRKSFIGHILNKEANQRLYGSLSVALLSALKGADILRVHDVSETKDVLKIMEVICSAD